MRDLLNPYDVRRYLNLWTIAAFDGDGDGGDGGNDDDGDSYGSTAVPTGDIDFTTIDLSTGEQTDVGTLSNDGGDFSWTGSDAYNTVDDDDGGGYTGEPSGSLVTGGATGNNDDFFTETNTGSNWNDNGGNTGGVSDSSDSGYNTSTSTETTTTGGGTTDTSTSTNTSTYVYTPPPVYTPPTPTYYYDEEGGRHTSKAARNAANAEIQRAEDRREALEYVQSRYNPATQDTYGFVSPAYASTNNQPIYGMNTAQDSRYSIDARQALGPELGYGTPASIAAERTLNNISNPEEMFPDEAYDALMDDEDFSVDYSIDDLLPPLPALDTPEDDKPSTPSVDFTGNIYSQDSPYFDDLKAKQGTGAAQPVDLNYPLGRPGQSTGTGGALATGIGTMVDLVGNAAQVAGEAVSPTSARVGYSAYESPLQNRYQPVDPALAEAVTGKKGATAVPTNFEPSDLTVLGREMSEIGSRLENRAMQNMPKDARDAMNSPIITVNDDEKYTQFPLDTRPAYQINTDSLKYNTFKTIPSFGATIASVPFGSPALLATGAVLGGGETAMEARDAVEAEALARGYSQEVATAMGNEASKIAGVVGAPLGAISNLAFAKMPPAGASLTAQIGKNAMEEAFMEGYGEQNVTALAEDIMTGTDKFGKAFSADEALLGAIGGAATTGIVGGAQTPETTTRQIGTEERNLLPSPSSFTTDTTPNIGQEFRGGPQAETEIGSMSAPVNTDTAPSTPSSETTPDNYSQAEKLMMNQLEDGEMLDVTDYDGFGLTLDEVQSLADSAISKKMDNDAMMLRALAEEEVIQTGGLSSEMNEEIRDKLPEDVANDIINTAITNPFVNNQGETRMDQILQMEQDKAATPPGPEKPFTPTGIETALGAAPSQESGPEIDDSTPSLEGVIEEETASIDTSNVDISDIIEPYQTTKDVVTDFEPKDTGRLGRSLFAATGNPIFLSSDDKHSFHLTAKAQRGAAYNKAFDAEVDRLTSLGMSRDEAYDAIQVALDQRFAEQESENKQTTVVVADQDTGLRGAAPKETSVQEDTSTNEETVVEVPATTETSTNTDFVLVEDPNTQQDLTVTVPVTEEVTTTPTTSVQPATVDVEPDEEETKDPVVEVVDDDTVRPITTVTDDGSTITECPEGYRMVEGTDGPYCVVDLTQSYTRQRAGRGIEAYTGIATKGQKGPGQKKKTVTKTTQKRRPVVTRRV